MKKFTVSRAALAGGCLWVAASACSGGSSGASPSPTPATGGAPGAPPVRTGNVERATFNPELNVHLDSMVRRASGLYVQDLATGTGGVATRGRTVIVRYTGWLADGTKFDSGEISVTLGSNQTIRAWEEGLLGMRVGGKRRLVVPPSMGYGGRGNGDVIPSNAVLVFEMELLSVL
jgi:FKBP-type peptidyl-prolyl cis-trans isomerase FkpA